MGRVDSCISSCHVLWTLLLFWRQSGCTVQHWPATRWRPTSRSQPTTRGQERASEQCPQSWEYKENAPANCQYEYKPKTRWKPSYGTTTTQSGFYCSREVGVEQHPSNYVYRGNDWRKKKVIVTQNSVFSHNWCFFQVNITQFRFFFLKFRISRDNVKILRKKNRI